MAYWLLKTEPSEYSFEDLLREKRTVWDGVTNALALKHMRAMGRGDLTFLYHTGTVRSIVGIAEVISNPHADPKADDPRIVVVTLRPVQPLVHPVPLAAIRALPGFADFGLLRLPRLSVVPVTPLQWKRLLTMSH